MKLAAIDIGSNSIHLVVVNADPNRRFQIITREKEMVRLAAGTLKTHHLSKFRIERALEVILRYVVLARARGAEQILITATSAVREADNKDYFVSRIRELTGVKVDILPGVEEARLIALAVTEAMNINRRTLIIDIGGGSTEFIVTEGGVPLLLLSMRLGAVRIADREDLGDPIHKKALAKLRASLRSDLARTVQEVRDLGFDDVIGTSGTILNLVSVASKLRDKQVTIDNESFTAFSHRCSLKELVDLNDLLATMTEKQRTQIPGLDPERADIIVAGGQLLEAILTGMGAKEIRTCDWALREGVLLDYLAKHIVFPHSGLGVIAIDEQSLDARDKTVLSIARRYEYQPTHSHQVAWLAGQLFDQMRELHRLSDEDRVLLQYAAILHDIGYHISHSNHHRHAYYLIQNVELPGFSAKEAAIIATTVRFHRGSPPKASRHPEYAALDKKTRKKVLKLSALLRLADGLDRSHRGLISQLAVHQSKTEWEIEFRAKDDCELELWYARYTVPYFENVFDIKLVISGSLESEHLTVTEPEVALAD